jgi:hypothetical protein
VEEQPLVPGRDLQQVADLGAAQPADVAQRDHEPLPARELADRRYERGARLAFHQLPLGIVLVHADLFERRGEGKAPGLAHAAILREVRHDRKQPDLERGASLEAVEAAQQREPRVLGHLLGDPGGSHIAEGHSHHGCVVAPDEYGEGVLVAAAKSRKKLPIVDAGIERRDRRAVHRRCPRADKTWRGYSGSRTTSPWVARRYRSGTARRPWLWRSHVLAEYRGVEAPVVGPGRQRAHPPDGVAPRRLEPLAGQPSSKLRIDLEQTND